MAEAWWQADPVVQAPQSVGTAGGNWWQGDTLAPQQPATAATAAPPAKPGGVVRNLAAGGNEMAADILGAPVDAMAWLLNKGHDLLTTPTVADVVAQQSGTSAAPRQPWITNPVGGSASIESLMGLAGADPRNVGANSTSDTVARNIGSGAVAMAAPYMGARALIARGIESGLPGAAARLLGGPAPPEAGALRTAAGAAGNAAVGAAGSAGGQAAQALLPQDSPYRPLADVAGQMLGGGLMAGGMGLAKAGINLGAGAARGLLAPMRQDSLDALVGNRLAAAASDPAAVTASLDAGNSVLVPGSLPTAGQLSGDAGIGRLEADLRQRFPDQFEARDAAQNAARVAALRTVAPGGEPDAVRNLLQARLAQVDAAGDASVQAAQQSAQAAFDQAGGRLPPEEYGAVMRDQLEQAKARAKAAESQLWKAIDPDNRLIIDGAPVRQEATSILSEIPQTAKPPDGEEKAVFGFAQLLGNATPFRDFTALRSRLLQAIRDERANGQTPALRRMQLLRAAMDNAISSTADRAALADPGLIERLSQRAGDVYGGADTAATATTAGGYGGGLPSFNPGGGSQLDVGLPGAAGNPGSGFGRAAGYPRLPAPPRPQDLIQFLRSRGGLAPNQGGELRGLDLHKLRGFARIIKDGGMSFDYAREAAVEAGYLHPDADINDLIEALRRNQQGNPVFSESDPAAVEFRAYERARRRGEFETFPPLPGEPANFDAAAALRYRAAANATRERAQTFNNPVIGPALAERGGLYRMAESRLPDRFISSPEGIQGFLAAGGDPATLREALVSDLRRAATGPDGTLNLTRFASWKLRRGAALRALPEMQPVLDNIATAQQAVDTIAASAHADRLAFERGSARHFLNAEPMRAVQAALNSRNPVADMRELSRLVAADPDARAGLQRAVADYIVQRFITNSGAADADGSVKEAFNEFLRRNLALREVFSAEQMAALRNVAEDMERARFPDAPAPAGSAKLSVVAQYLGHGLAGLGGYLLGGLHGAVEGTGAYTMGKAALDALRRAGIERTDQLLVEALLNPALAKTLLMKASDNNRPFIAQRLAQQLGTLVAVSGADATAGRAGSPSSARMPLPDQSKRSAVPVPVRGSLAARGALALP